jgi:predicted RNA-binding Zn-ribbon protein involved in translation (DUF1610 family)
MASHPEVAHTSPQKVCVSCAKEFDDASWRVSCDRCGNVAINRSFRTLGMAQNRAFRQGWKERNGVYCKGTKPKLSSIETGHLPEEVV